jgi:hypothetical protein
VIRVNRQIVWSQAASESMNFWIVKNPWIFYGAGGALLVYLLYMMFRRRKGERGGIREREPEL